MKPHSWRAFATRALVLLAVLYLGVVTTAFFIQRSLQYFPDPVDRAPEADGPPIQVVHLTTKDGEHLIAWYLPPQAGKPVMLFFNGNGGGLLTQKHRWRRIAKAGVGFFAVGYRGYAGSSGHPTEAGLHMDAEAAYAWLAARYRPGDIVIHGYSLGSGMAVPLAAQHPSRALILEAPFSSASDVAAIKTPWLPTRIMLRDRYMNSDWIGRVHVPVLVVHGDVDSVIPFELGLKLYGLANPPKQFVRMPGSDHNTLVRDGLYPHIWAFLGVDAGEDAR